MSETYKKEIVQHIIRNLLEIKLLRTVQAQPTWGYKIKKQVETDFNIKLRHGALYPTLNSLEEKGFVLVACGARVAVDAQDAQGARHFHVHLPAVVEGKTLSTRSPVEQLSDRELEVFEWLGQGRTTRQIAEKLRVSVKTVQAYCARIKEKLNLASATELLREAVRWYENTHKG